MNTVLDFQEIKKEDVMTAGGKGANLGEMTAAGIESCRKKSKKQSVKNMHSSANRQELPSVLPPLPRICRMPALPVSRKPT